MYIYICIYIITYTHTHAYTRAHTNMYEHTIILKCTCIYILRAQTHTTNTV